MNEQAGAAFNLEGCLLYNKTLLNR
jgi:hypothetical protein